MAWSKVSEYMASQMADLARYKSEPTEPFEWGSDLDCANDLQENMAELRKDDLLLVVQSCYRRLTTRHGTLVDAPDYGFSVKELIHAGLAPKDEARIAGQIQAELTKDDRLETVEAAATFTDGAVAIEVSGMTRVGNFSMTMGVTAASASLLSYEVNQ